MSTSKEINIRKASGELVPYDPEKVRESLERAHVSDSIIGDIINQVNNTVSDGMDSHELYNWIYQLLDEYDTPTAARYNLKNAIMQLGPTGYPFEKFLSQILIRLGYTTTVGEIVQGRCIKHEVDVLATKDSTHYMIEAKYHNQPGSKTDVQAALYTYARFTDIREKWESDPSEGHEVHQGWLITNTKLTSDAIEYAECVGLQISSWDYPLGASLRRLITEGSFHPITAIKNMNQKQRDLLFTLDKVLCLDILDMTPEDVMKYDLEKAFQEAKAIVDNNGSVK